MASKFLSVLCIFLLSAAAFAAEPIASSGSLATTERRATPTPITTFDITLFGFQFLVLCTKAIGPITVPMPVQASNVGLKCGDNRFIFNVTTSTLGLGFYIAPLSQFIRFIPFEINCKLVVDEIRSDCGMGTASGKGGHLESGLKVDKVLRFGKVKFINYVAKGFHYKKHL